MLQWLGLKLNLFSLVTGTNPRSRNVSTQVFDSPQSARRMSKHVVNSNDIFASFTRVHKLKCKWCIYKFALSFC